MTEIKIANVIITIAHNEAGYNIQNLKIQVKDFKLTRSGCIYIVSFLLILLVYSMKKTLINFVLLRVNIH